jgi:hypothetical protein
MKKQLENAFSMLSALHPHNQSCVGVLRVYPQGSLSCLGFFRADPSAAAFGFL